MAAVQLLQKWLFGSSETTYHQNVMESYAPKSPYQERADRLRVVAAPTTLVLTKRLIGPPPRNHMIHILLEVLISPSSVRIWQNRPTARTGQPLRPRQPELPPK